MISIEETHKILGHYDTSKLTIATMCRHSALQLFYSAKREGFNTIGFYQQEDEKKTYQAFPASTPDEFIQVNKYTELGESKITDELLEKNSILILHGSFVNLGSDFILNDLKVPTFGNRYAIQWEEDRKKQRMWLEEKAGLKMPKEYSPDEIEKGKIYFVKFGRARGGKGFFQCRSRSDFKDQIKILKKSGEIGEEEEPTIQEYISGTRYYFHYFLSPLSNEDWKVGDKAQLTLMGIDRRDETDIDDLPRTFLSVDELRKSDIRPTYTVVGNTPLIARESNLPKVFKMGERAAEASFELFPPGMIGPFCLETFCKPDMSYTVFEVSARIVAGTNYYIHGSPYAELAFGQEASMSMGKRIALEIDKARKQNRLKEIIT